VRFGGKLRPESGHDLSLTLTLGNENCRRVVNDFRRPEARLVIDYHVHRNDIGDDLVAYDTRENDVLVSFLQRTEQSLGGSIPPYRARGKFCRRTDKGSQKERTFHVLPPFLNVSIHDLYDDCTLLIYHILAKRSTSLPIEYILTTRIHLAYFRHLG
jgi:hypothetical protein